MSGLVIDTLRGKLEMADAMPERWDGVSLLKPLGPLVGLGYNEPETVRATLRKIGVDKIVVSPDGQGGWTFKGEGDFARLILGNGHKRSKAAPHAPRARKRPGLAGPPLGFPLRSRRRDPFCPTGVWGTRRGPPS
jgi:hypothetical protein